MHPGSRYVVPSRRYTVPELLWYELLGEFIIPLEQGDLNPAHGPEPEMSRLTRPANELVKPHDLLPGITETAQFEQAQDSHQVSFGQPLVIVHGFGEGDDLVAE